MMVRGYWLPYSVVKLSAQERQYIQVMRESSKGQFSGSPVGGGTEEGIVFPLECDEWESKFLKWLLCYDVMKLIGW